MSDNNTDKKELEQIKDVYAMYMSDSKFSDKWSGSNSGNQFIYKERFHSMKKILGSYVIKLYNKKILEVSCAGGNIITSLLNLGAIEENIHGVDIRSNRVNDAIKTYLNIKITIMNGNSGDIRTAFR